MRVALIALLVGTVVLAGCESGFDGPANVDVTEGEGDSAPAPRPGDAGPAEIVEAGGDASEAAEDVPGPPPAPPEPVVGEAIPVVPSDGLPPEVVLQAAANNLDAVQHEGRFFLAFRTAPDHFASPEATLYVVSSQDRATWTFEAVFERDRDLREPRLLSWNGKLFLYFAVLGSSAIDFEPGGMMVAERLGPARWSEAEWFYEEGFIPWRARVVDGVPYLVTYVGGEGIYDADAEPIEVHWLTTGDGRNWRPVVPGQPTVLRGGCSETDFAFLDDGTLIAVCRNEMGDEDGWGSKVCRAEADALGDWICVPDPKKYDSPIVFRHGPHVYLIGRRNVTADGRYDLGRDDLSPGEQTMMYEWTYWRTPKRCSLWRVDPYSMTVLFEADLPSRGDTCFPAVVPLAENTYEVYNYTSPLDGPDLAWFEGQHGPTTIYRAELSFR